MFAEKEIPEVLDKLKTSQKQGLTGEEQEKRRKEYGENLLEDQEKKGMAASFLEQLQDPLIYVLMAAIAISVFLGEYGEASIIATVILLNATVGVVQEGKARKAIEALHRMSAPKALVRMDGAGKEIESRLLVPGDIVLLEAGRQIPADLRLLESENLKVEESALTGESMPVEKMAHIVLEPEKAISDCINMAYMSTFVTYGRGEGVVTATGMQTEIGKIAGLINQTNREMTPLQKRLADLGRLLSIVAVCICGAMFLLAVWQKRDISDMLLTAISLAVAAVPEGLPAVVTIVLALSVYRMVKVNTIVRRLPSVETLGAVNVICSDKTGTLTQNQMTVCDYETETDLQRLIEAGILCNDASIEQTGRLGDPTELALLDFAIKQEIDVEEIRRRNHRTAEVPFDSVRKSMTVCCHSTEMGTTEKIYTKGALERILQSCTHLEYKGEKRTITASDKKRILRRASQMTGRALRVLAFAKGSQDTWREESNLTFLGIVGMMDPPRPEVKEAIALCRSAHVDTRMITGDHVDTAYAIARELGIAGEKAECTEGQILEQLTEEELQAQIGKLKVFARVSPTHKVRIVKALQAQGKTVAMTGDGVNDAPSLQCADVGIAMGKCGTDVARNAADMVLTDDNFATIVKAIQEGREIYENIRKTILFLLSSNFGEIITMVLAVVFKLPMPLRASHILWVNLITDSLPALALGTDNTDSAALMHHQPRDRNENLFAGGGLTCTLCYGFLIAAITLAAFLQVPIEARLTQQIPINLHNIEKVLTISSVLHKAQTHAFTVLGMSQLMHAIGMRDVGCSIFRMKHLENWLMVLSVGLGILLQVVVTEIPYLVRIFDTSKLQMREWVGLLLLSMAPLLLHEMLILCDRKRE